jgi:hypothetical protein
MRVSFGSASTPDVRSCFHESRNSAIGSGHLLIKLLQPAAKSGAVAKSYEPLA